MRVFLSYGSEHHELATRVSSALRELDYEVVRAETFLEPGDDVGKRIKEELLNADALVLLWSQRASEDKFLTMEVGFFMGSSNVRPIVPVLLDDAELPSELRSRLHLKADQMRPDEIALKVATVLSRFQGERQKSQKVAEQRKEEVEKSSESYITDSLDSLTKREKRYQLWALVCYLLGYATILGGLAYAVVRITREPPDFADASQSIYVSTLTVTAIGFVAAASRFAFVLGKSFMVEALRNHDRIHAIKFGEFYLKAFGENADWDDLKEAFQHWNLDTGSTFKEQKEDSVDPQVLKILGDLVKTIKK